MTPRAEVVSSAEAMSNDSPIAELYRTERPRVLALCMHIVGAPHDAEDATQETFALAHRAFPMFRGEAQLLTWVLRIAVRVSVEARARRGRRTWSELDEQLPSTADPHREVEGREQMRRFVAALEQLSVEQRAVLGLFALEGLSHAEIASVLGVSEGTVWSRLGRARARLIGLMGA
jgi:RNA polymerase sigma-70 factor (ECF subfamily)